MSHIKNTYKTYNRPHIRNTTYHNHKSEIQLMIYQRNNLQHIENNTCHTSKMHIIITTGHISEIQVITNQKYNLSHIRNAIYHMTEILITAKKKTFIYKNATYRVTEMQISQSQQMCYVESGNRIYHNVATLTHQECVYFSQKLFQLPFHVCPLSPFLNS